jgi:hypothetical protein
MRRWTCSSGASAQRRRSGRLRHEAIGVRRIYTELEGSETPTDLRDGEMVEAIRRGGPRDGAIMGRFRVLNDEQIQLTLVEGTWDPEPLADDAQ